MPSIKKGESRAEYLKRAIPMMMAEGLTQRQAVGRAEGMYNSKKGMKNESLAHAYAKRDKS